MYIFHPTIYFLTVNKNTEFFYSTMFNSFHFVHSLWNNS